MHELIFADSAIPPQIECLGLPLAPYTLGHELALLRHRSPFLCATRAEFEALGHPAQVLSLTFAVQLCAARRPNWLWKYRNHDYALAIAEFRNYLDANRQIIPALSAENEADAEAYEIANKGEKMSGGRSLGSPFIANLIVFCLTDLRLTYQEALESPFGVTANLYFAAMESKGQMFIENHKEAEARADMARNRADVKNEITAARAELAACLTVAGREAAYAKNPRLGTLFGEQWHMAPDEAARIALVRQWGNVAITELSRAQIDPAPYLKGTSCQA